MLGKCSLRFRKSSAKIMGVLGRIENFLNAYLNIHLSFFRFLKYVLTNSGNLTKLIEQGKAFEGAAFVSKHQTGKFQRQFIISMFHHGKHERFSWVSLTSLAVYKIYVENSVCSLSFYDDWRSFVPWINQPSMQNDFCCDLINVEFFNHKSTHTTNYLY